MDEELLLSGIECFISVGNNDEETKEQKEQARSMILRNGGFVRDFIDEDINVVIGINDSYDHIQKLLRGFLLFRISGFRNLYMQRQFSPL